MVLRNVGRLELDGCGLVRGKSRGRCTRYADGEIDVDVGDDSDVGTVEKRVKKIASRRVKHFDSYSNRLLD